MTFKEFLIYRDIPFKEVEGEGIAVDDELIIPYELEFREKVKEGELWWDYLRYRCEPKGISDNEQTN